MYVIIFLLSTDPHDLVSLPIFPASVPVFSLNVSLVWALLVYWHFWIGLSDFAHVTFKTWSLDEHLLVINILNIKFSSRTSYSGKHLLMLGPLLCYSFITLRMPLLWHLPFYCKCSDFLTCPIHHGLWRSSALFLKESSVSSAVPAVSRHSETEEMSK